MARRIDLFVFDGGVPTGEGSPDFIGFDVLPVPPEVSPPCSYPVSSVSLASVIGTPTWSRIPTVPSTLGPRATSRGTWAPWETRERGKDSLGLTWDTGVRPPPPTRPA